MTPVLTSIILAAGLAQAHPSGRTFPSYRALVTVGDGQVRLDLGALIPTPWILEELKERCEGGKIVRTPDTPGGATLEGCALDEAEEAAFTAAKLDELAANVRVEIDGAFGAARQPLDAPSGQGDERYLKYQIALAAPLEGPGPHTIQISNANYPEEHSFYMNEVRVAPALQVTRSSMFRWEDGRIRGDLDGQWRMEEDLREIEIELIVHEGAGAALRRRLAGEAARPSSQAFEPPPLEALQARRVTPELIYMGAAGALAGAVALAGAAASIRRRRR